MLNISSPFYKNILSLLSQNKQEFFVKINNNSLIKNEVYYCEFTLSMSLKTSDDIYKSQFNITVLFVTNNDAKIINDKTYLILKNDSIFKTAHYKYVNGKPVIVTPKKLKINETECSFVSELKLIQSNNDIYLLIKTNNLTDYLQNMPADITSFYLLGYYNPSSNINSKYNITITYNKDLFNIKSTDDIVDYELISKAIIL